MTKFTLRLLAKQGAQLSAYMHRKEVKLMYHYVRVQFITSDDKKFIDCVIKTDYEEDFNRLINDVFDLGYYSAIQESE